MQDVFVAISLYTEDNAEQYPGDGHYWNSPALLKGLDLFQTYISSYLKMVQIDVSWSYQRYYLPSFSCPSNQEVDIVVDWRQRPHFVQGTVNGNKKPFGIRGGKTNLGLPSLYKHEILYPNISTAYKDIFAPHWTVPDLPVHMGHSIN